ncbi:MAG TPA: LPS assembly lipoprotein LptE [Candidatus Binataceae bacterium]|nr:LPS assembly lipoprotein LptE [Candidatus Binataceae bacterium]
MRRALLLGLTLALAGCGYQFAASGTNLPSDSRTIYVERFGNHTRQTGVNDEFMRYVKDEIARHHRLRLVDSPAQADLELTGEVVAVNSLAGSFNAVLEPTIYNQSVTVSAALTDLRTNKILWSVRSLSNAQQAPVVAQAVVATTPLFLQHNLRSADIAQLPDAQVAQTQTAMAKTDAMTQLAQNLYASMAEGF